jgi:hypothetical protein
VAAVNWPVTVGAAIDYNIPEYFASLTGGGVDLKSVQEKSTPGLLQEIFAEYPSAATRMMDDRVRALATIYILKRYQPDFTLLHLMEHDEAAHESGPFTRESIATLEYTDELLGQILAAAPANTVVAIVSDHGFEADPQELNMSAFFASKKLPTGGTVVKGGYVVTFDSSVAAALASAQADTASCVGREIPRAEVDRFLPGTAAGARLFEPAPGCFFANGKPGGELIAKPTEIGRHGHWPLRYRASFVLSGPGIKTERTPELDMRDAVKYFAKILNLDWPPRP